MRDRWPSWLIGAALGLLGGGLLAMDALAHAQAATLLVEVKGPAAGRVTVIASDGAIVARGAAGRPLTVAPGTYAIRVEQRGGGRARVLPSVRLAPRARVRRVVDLTRRP